MSEAQSRTILILGGYGVFGGHLAARLSREARYKIIVAGRSLEKAQAFCAAHGGEPAELDLTRPDLAERIAAHAPFVVVDAAGPFQAYRDDPYRVAHAAIACGAHYLDLSDDAEFTTGITVCDSMARAAGVTVLSGVSSLPALSSAIVDDLAKGLSRIDLIESTILPDHARKRGLSVIQAILAQAGKPLTIWRGDLEETVPVWSGPTRAHLTHTGSAPLRRTASLIGAPDLPAFRTRYAARSVLTRAGLGSWPEQYGLWALSLLVRAGLVKTLTGLAKPLQAASEVLRPFGSRRGGMQVRVLGRATNGAGLERVWSLISENGTGPQIPAMPAFVMCDKLCSGGVDTGARAALGEFSRTEAEAALAPLNVSFASTELPYRTLFETALKSELSRLPKPIRDLHDVLYARQWQGKAEIKRGHGILSRLVGLFMGFPQAGTNIDVRVRMQRRGPVETWERDFGGKRFRSHLSLAGPEGSGRVWERFGPVKMELGLFTEDEALHFPVRAGRVFGIPLPQWFLPRSDTREYVDAQGRACFDVEISMPVAGHVVSYKGWLEPCGQPTCSLSEPCHSVDILAADNSPSA